jgi:hypothetical protein
MIHSLKRILAFILLLFVSWGAIAAYAGEIIVTNSSQSNLNFLLKKALSSAPSATDSDPVLIRLSPGMYSFNGDLIIPDNVHLIVGQGAVIRILNLKTLTINRSLEAGPYQIFSCTERAKVVFTNNVRQGQIQPEWWKAPVDAYWHAAIQQAIDAAETSKIPIFFSQDMSINGTLYLGNAPLISNSKTLTIVADNDFVSRGSGILNWNAAILAKSGNLAGYGLSTTVIKIQGLNLNFNRTSSRGHWVALSLENCTGSIQDAEFTTSSTLTTDQEASPLDLYRGVSDFVVNNCSFNLKFAGGRGGFWIRNYSTSKPAKNITVSNCIFRSSQWDEALAVFTTMSGANISDVLIKDCKFYVTGARDVVLATYISSNNAIATIKNVRWTNITVISDTAVNGSIFYASPGSGTLENVTGSGFYVETPTTSAGYDTRLFKGLTSIDNSYIKVTGDTGLSYKLIIFLGIGRLSNCENVFTGSIARNPIAAKSCGLIENCSLIGTVE